MDGGNVVAVLEFIVVGIESMVMVDGVDLDLLSLCSSMILFCSIVVAVHQHQF